MHMLSSESYYFITMEYLAGGSLTSWIQGREYPPDETTVIYIIQQLLTGVARMHAEGIVHRDLNPGNVLIVHEVEVGPRVKIIDFGFAAKTDQ